MSNSAAIAAVTATLTKMIQSAVDVDATVAGGKVTARPPDRARQGATGNQVNLFLYRTSIDAAWRNQDPPSIRPGEAGQPPLPLVLSYLITGYGENDEEILAHRLLGIAMSVLNDKPLLSRQEIQRSLAPAAGSDLENQIERVRITPDPRPQDEISRMWSTFGTGYRLSVSYDAAVVLIDSTQPAVAPPPVLQRGSGDPGPTVGQTFLPDLAAATPPNQQAAARPGDTVTLLGRNLDAVTDVVVTHARLGQTSSLAPSTRTATTLTVQLPDPPALPAGVATVVAQFDAGTGTPVASNAIPLALAPVIVSNAELKAKLKPNAATPLTVTCAPAVEPGQTAALVVGSQLVPVVPVAAATSSLTFQLSGFTAGTYTLRLRVDSVDSIPVAGTPPPSSPDEPAPMQFDPNQQLVLT
jgi:Pvc16 N-terminal domain